MKKPYVTDYFGARVFNAVSYTHLPDLEIFLPEEEAGKSVDLLTLEQDTQLRAALDYLR